MSGEARVGPMPPTPVLDTARLILRPVRAADAPAVQRGFSQWEVVRLLSAKIPWPYPEGGAAANMPNALGEMERGEQCHWAVTPRGGGDELIGWINIWPDDGVSRDQRGFWLDPAFWGQGLMSEAAERVTEFAFLELGWPHLWLCNAETNTASHRIKEKQGARLVDRTPANYVSGPGVRVTWLLTREAWLARRAKAPAG
jgi:RimJ/RimL family protein N-acetyltransferase